MSWIRLAVRYRKVRSRDNRWGRGKVHVEYYDRLNNAWELMCTDEVGGGMGWEEVESFAEVECKKCLKSEHAWKPRAMKCVDGPGDCDGEVRYVTCPFAEEIEGDTTRYWLCESHEQDRANDI